MIFDFNDFVHLASVESSARGMEASHGDPFGEVEEILSELRSGADEMRHWLGDLDSHGAKQVNQFG